MNHKIITSTGYGGTGSSAVIDFVSEFEHVHSLGNTELWMLQDFHGISDLEHHLIDANHRSKINLAVNNFKSYIRSQSKFYSSIFGDKFLSISFDYIDSLIDARFTKAISEYELKSRLIKQFIFSVSPKIQYGARKILNKNFSVEEFAPAIPNVSKCYSIPDRTRFYSQTNRYLHSLFSELNTKSNCTHIAIDQFVPAMNGQRYLNYLDDMRIVVVDRDPRDLYLLNQLHWKGASYICDTSNIHEYISWYKTMREHKKFDSPNRRIKFIMLEDLVYNYNHTSNELIDFYCLNIKDHVNKFKKFNPEVSKQWTRIWRRTDSFKDEVNYIKSELYEYCWE